MIIAIDYDLGLTHYTSDTPVLRFVTLFAAHYRRAPRRHKTATPHHMTSRLILTGKLKYYICLCSSHNICTTVRWRCYHNLSNDYNTGLLEPKWRPRGSPVFVRNNQRSQIERVMPTMRTHTYSCDGTNIN